jgi:hypothetical protein
LRPRRGRTTSGPPSSAGAGRNDLLRRWTLVILLAGLTLPAVARGSHGWPVKPFDEPHPLRGGFCDPRMGDRSQLFHFGVDIAARDGTPVYAVAAGIAWIDPAFPRTVEVLDGTSHITSYWHIVPAVSRGMVVGTHQLLGHVAHGAGHVHLTERLDGLALNPLRPDGLAPYRDKTAPLVQAVVAERHRTELVLDQLSGRIDLVAEVFDLPELPLPAPWTNNLLTPARVAWRLVGADGGVVRPLRLVFDCLTAKPADTLFWEVFAAGTSQNRPGTPGTYRFWLARGLDTMAYPDGDYRVDVIASDVRGNVAVQTVPIKIQNLTLPSTRAYDPE